MRVKVYGVVKLEARIMTSPSRLIGRAADLSERHGTTMKRFDVTFADTPIACAADESGQAAAVSPGVGYAERVITSCYRDFQWFEQDIRDNEKSKRISRETPYRMLMDIADRAFTLASDTKSLNNLQRAQILDIILRVAELMGRTF
jgi:hypothetical protein